MLVILVLEGPLSASLTSPSVYATVCATYHSLLLRDKLQVVRTDDVGETAKFVLSLANRFSSYFRPPSDFSNIVHVPAGRKLSGVHLPYLKLLMSVKGVSANRAQAIASVCPTMEALVGSLREHGTSQLAQLIASSPSRAVGSAIGLATAVNLAEAVLGPSDPIVSQVKLLKYLMTGAAAGSAGNATSLCTKYGSIQNLRREYLRDPAGVPAALALQLAALMDDPATLLVGLKGVRGISAKTADAITARFSCVRLLHSSLQAVASRAEAVTLIRMVGCESKRMIARPAVENVLVWLEAEGFIQAFN